jgi:hypothetical protein
MGFERTILSAMISAALLSSASAHAAGAKEPLIITKASNADAIVLASNDGAKMSLARAETSEAGSIDQAINDFARAVGDAIRAEQEATEAACKASNPPKANTAAAFHWRARCSYVRR